jgi:phage antirepressor YoqD-like protein
VWLLRERGVLRPQGGRRVSAEAQDEAKAPSRPESNAKVREILPPDQAAEALARYAEGEAPRAIAVVLGVPATRIYRLLREAGVLRTPSEARALRYEPRRAARELERLEAEAERAQRAQVEAELADKVIERYAAGESGPAIAEALGLGAERVYTILRKRGVLRSRVETMQVRAQTGAISDFVGKRAEPLPAEVAAEVLARYAAGEGGTAIAKALGLKQWQVYELLRERGAMRSIGETKRMAARRQK